MAHPVLALLKKNAILKRSRPFGLLFELLLPVAFVYMISMSMKQVNKSMDEVNGGPKQVKPAADKVRTLQPIGYWSEHGTFKPKSLNMVVAESGKSEFFPLLRDSDLGMSTPIGRDDTDDQSSFADDSRFSLDFDQTDDSKVGIAYSTGSDGFIKPLLLAIHGVYVRLTGNLAGVNNVDMVVFGTRSEHGNAEMMLTALASMIMMSFSSAVSYLSSAIVEERMLRLREVMKIQGVRDWHFYLSWFLTYGSIYLFQALSVAGVAVFTSLPEFSFLLMAVGGFLFLMSAAALVLTVTSVFDSPRIGTMVGMGTMFFLSTFTVGIDTAGKSPLKQLHLMLLPQFGFIHFMRGAGRMANVAEGLTMSNVFSTVDDQYNPGLALVMLLVDMVLYNALYYYIEKVVPHEFGQTLPWYFPFSLEYWRGSQQAASVSSPAAVETSTEESDCVREEFNQREQQLIVDGAVAEFKHMTKVFKTDGVKLKAVDDVSFTMFPSEIICLLGANSAGKTTLTSMLLGLIEATAGEGRVLGLDLMKQQSQIRRVTGYCPQQDVLWPELTVIQHLQLYGSIRGLSSFQARQQALDALNDPSFQAKAQTKVKNLSGGMKRKLCLMIAFMGNTKFVLADEATTGCDPFSRRAMWEYMKGAKAGRIVCLTTHFLDEAELLGDRIAIMAMGRLKAYGSSLYLKQAFGGGYQLRIARSGGAGSDARIVAAIQSIVEDTEIEVRTNTELVTRIPMEKSDKLKDLFETIDSKKQELGVENYTLSGAKLEDVFMKIAKASLPAAVRKANEGAEEAIEESEKHTGVMLVLFQIFAILMKRVHLSYRSINVVFFGVVIPIGLCIFGAELPGLMNKWLINPVHGTLAFEPKKYKIAVAHNPECTKSPSLTSLVSELDSMKTYDKVQLTIDPAAVSVSSYYGSGYSVADPKIRRSDLIPVMTSLAEASQKHPQLEYVVGLAHCGKSGRSPVGYVLMLRKERLNEKKTLEVLAEFMSKIHDYKFNLSETDKQKKPKITRNIWESEAKIMNLLFSVLAVLCISVGLSFFGPVVGLFVANERLKGVKFQQLVSGLRVETYWLGTLLFDFVLFSIVTGVIALYFNISKLDLFEMKRFFGLVFAYSIGSITLTYFCSRFTATPMGTFWFSFSLNVIPAILGAVCGLVRVTQAFSKAVGNRSSSDEPGSVIEVLEKVGFAFPAFHLAKGTMGMAGKVIFVKLLEGIGAVGRKLVLEDKVGECQTRALLMGGGFLVLVLVMDFVAFNVLTRRKEEKKIEDEEAVPVLAEQQQTTTGDSKSAALLEVSNVHKSFGSLRAVKGVSFESHAGEVFGLLGTNSAGKTTTVKIAIGEIAMDSGSVYIDGIHVHSHLQSVRSKFGYCAQHDALFEDLTVAEHLSFYAAVKGIPRKNASEEIERVVNVLGLTAFVNTRGGKLSGGNKRKLSLAMAVIGGPSVLFADEPSSGTDPLSQRFLWGIMRRLANARRTIILTTHSMEEAEAVSDRVGIMMSGQFKCIGTLQDIKASYGRGFEISVQARSPSAAELTALKVKLSLSSGLQLDEDWAVLTTAQCLKFCGERSGKLVESFKADFAGAAETIGVGVFVEWLAEYEACEVVHNFLSSKLAISDPQIVLTKVETVGLASKYLVSRVGNLSGIFSTLEVGKTEEVISDYSLTQFSLEQIFNNFAKEDADLRRVKDVPSVDSTEQDSP